MMAGLAVLTFMDVLVKIVGARYPTLPLVAMRFAFGTLAALAVWWVLQPGWPSRATIRANALRGIVVAATSTTFFYALQRLPLAEAIAFSFLSPFCLALFGWLILSERIGRLTLAGLIVGFGGMAIMTFGQSKGSALPADGIAAAVASAAFYALSLVLLRQRAQTDALITIVLFQNAIPGLVVAAPALAQWQPVPLGDLLLFAAIGTLGVAGHLLMARAFRASEAARLAPFEYVSLIYAVAFGFLFFGEIPGTATLAGSLLIVGGTALAFREKAGA